MAKRLCDALKDCKKEEEVKASFCSFFKMKINALEFAALKQAHDVLRAKLLPKVYEYGFLNPDVEVFK